MTYVDGCVFAVPKANKEAYIEFAKRGGSIFKEYGALSIVECWGDDIPDGEVTSFPMAVQCKEDEVVCFSWITWPSREFRNEAMQKLFEDPRMVDENSQMPFDGKRLIYGGFEVLIQS